MPGAGPYTQESAGCLFALLENEEAWVATRVLPPLFFVSQLLYLKNGSKTIYLSYPERLNGTPSPQLHCSFQELFTCQEFWGFFFFFSFLNIYCSNFH